MAYGEAVKKQSGNQQAETLIKELIGYIYTNSDSLVQKSKKEALLKIANSIGSKKVGEKIKEITDMIKKG